MTVIRDDIENAKKAIEDMKDIRQQVNNEEDEDSKLILLNRENLTLK